MSFDIVALCRRQPTLEVMVAAMLAAGPDLKVDLIDQERLIQLYRPPDRLVMTTEGPRLVQVHGEVRRLLGINIDIEPVWWVETHAPARDSEAEAIAREFATAVAAQTEGILWATR